MVRTIPLTHYREYLAQAQAIQQTLGDQTDPATVRQAVVDLAGLAVRALEETMQAFEGMTMLLMALHREVKRSPARPERRTTPVRPHQAGPRTQ